MPVFSRSPGDGEGFNHATQLAISAAASASKLLGLSGVEIANATAIATVDNISLACVHAEPVSQWKGFSPGMTGMRAIYAASPAKRGFEGPSGLLEGPDGLERVFGSTDSCGLGRSLARDRHSDGAEEILFTHSWPTGAGRCS